MPRIRNLARALCSQWEEARKRAREKRRAVRAAKKAREAKRAAEAAKAAEERAKAKAEAERKAAEEAKAKAAAAAAAEAKAKATAAAEAEAEAAAAAAARATSATGGAAASGHRSKRPRPGQLDVSSRDVPGLRAGERKRQRVASPGGAAAAAARGRVTSSPKPGRSSATSGGDTPMTPLPVVEMAGPDEQDSQVLFVGAEEGDAAKSKAKKKKKSVRWREGADLVQVKYIEPISHVSCFAFGIPRRQARKQLSSPHG